MKIPKKVKIGAHWYKIVYVVADECGSIDREKMCIFINPAYSKDTQEATFFHEVLHGINNELDHTVLEGLAEQLYAVLVENKLLK